MPTRKSIEVDPTNFIEHGTTLDPVPSLSTIKIVFDPYNYLEVSRYLREITRDFGPANRGRWYFETESYNEVNTWALKFFFSDPRDATLFGLKYSL